MASAVALDSIEHYARSSDVNVACIRSEMQYNIMSQGELCMPGIRFTPDPERQELSPDVTLARVLVPIHTTY